MTTTTTPTNIDRTNLAKLVKSAHSKATNAFKKSLTHAKEAGSYLAQVHANCSYPDFLAWAINDCGISQSTADNYVRIHRNWEAIKGEDNYTSALKALRKRRNTNPKDVVPVQPLSAWQDKIQKAMTEFHVKGTIQNVQRFLEEFGVREPQQNLAA